MTPVQWLMQEFEMDFTALSELREGWPISLMARDRVTRLLSRGGVVLQPIFSFKDDIKPIHVGGGRSDVMVAYGSDYDMLEQALSYEEMLRRQFSGNGQFDRIEG